MEERLTEKQKQVLRFIAKRIWRQRNAPTIREIAGHFNFSSTGTVRDYLRTLEKKGYLRLEKKKSRAIELVDKALLNIPVVAQVYAGGPTITYEDVEGYLDLERILFRDDQIFALRVKGESMIGAGIMPEDLVMVRRQLICNNGDIIVALIDGETTVKYFRQKKGKTYLEPANKDFKPIAVNGNFTIIGKVISVVRRYV